MNANKQHDLVFDSFFSLQVEKKIHIVATNERNRISQHLTEAAVCIRTWKTNMGNTHITGRNVLAQDVHSRNMTELNINITLMKSSTEIGNWKSTYAKNEKWFLFSRWKTIIIPDTIYWRPMKFLTNERNHLEIFNWLQHNIS